MKRPVQTTIALFTLLVLLAAMLGFMACNSSTNSNANALTGSPTPTPVVDCSTATHQQILKTIYDVISNSKYAAQQYQFNITESGKVVTIIGWSPDYVAITSLVTATVKGCSVNTNNFKAAYCDLDSNFRIIRTCAPGYYPCGDICIMVGEICNLWTADGPGGSDPHNCNVSNTNTNTNTNTNNTNANANSNTKTNTKY